MSRIVANAQNIRQPKDGGNIRDGLGTPKARTRDGDHKPEEIILRIA
jgi:hypothetical protein